MAQAEVVLIGRFGIYARLEASRVSLCCGAVGSCWLGRMRLNCLLQYKSGHLSYRRHYTSIEKGYMNHMSRPQWLTKGLVVLWGFDHATRPRLPRLWLARQWWWRLPCSWPTKGRLLKPIPCTKLNPKGWHYCNTVK